MTNVHAWRLHCAVTASCFVGALVAAPPPAGGFDQPHSSIAETVAELERMAQEAEGNEARGRFQEAANTYEAMRTLSSATWGDGHFRSQQASIWRDENLKRCSYDKESQEAIAEVYSKLLSVRRLANGGHVDAALAEASAAIKTTSERGWTESSLGTLVYDITGEVRTQASDFGGAVEAFTIAVALGVRVYPSPNTWQVNAMNRLVACMLQCDRYAEANDESARALKCARHVMSAAPDDPRSIESLGAACLNRAAFLFLCEGKRNEALAHIQEAVDVLSKCDGSRPWNLVVAQITLADACLACGEERRAAAAATEAQRGMEKYAVFERPPAWSAWMRLADVSVRLGNVKDAKRFAEKGDELLTRASAYDRKRFHLYSAVRARIAAAANAEEVADKMYADAIAFAKLAFGEFHPFVRTRLKAYVEFKHAQKSVDAKRLELWIRKIDSEIESRIACH